MDISAVFISLQRLWASRWIYHYVCDGVRSTKLKDVFCNSTCVKFHCARGFLELYHSAAVQCGEVWTGNNLLAAGKKSSRLKWPRAQKYGGWVGVVGRRDEGWCKWNCRRPCECSYILFFWMLLFNCNRNLPNSCNDIQGSLENFEKSGTVKLIGKMYSCQ